MIDNSISLKTLNKTGKANLQEHLGIEFIEITKTVLKAKMPVDQRTFQPLGLLHGGASAALAETVGSMASYLSIDRNIFFCVGLELKINHLKQVTGQYVIATAEAIHIGSQTHVWQIKTHNAQGDLIAISTLSMAILPLNEQIKSKINNLLKEDY